MASTTSSTGLPEQGGEDQAVGRIHVRQDVESGLHLGAVSLERRPQGLARAGGEPEIEVEQGIAEAGDAHLLQRLEKMREQLRALRRLLRGGEERGGRDILRKARGELKPPGPRLPGGGEQRSDQIPPPRQGGGAQGRRRPRAGQHLDGLGVPGACPQRQQAAGGGRAHLRQAVMEPRRQGLAEPARQDGDLLRPGQPFDHVGEQAEHRLLVDLDPSGRPVRGQGAEGELAADPRQGLGRERADQRIGQPLGQKGYGLGRPQIPEGLHGGHLHPQVGAQERHQVRDRPRVPQVADGEDRLLLDVGIGVGEGGVQRLERPRIAQPVEDEDRLQHHVRIGIAQQPHDQRQAAAAAQPQDLGAGVAQRGVGRIAQILGQPGIGEDGGADTQRLLADARARVAHEPLERLDAGIERHRGEPLEDIDAFVPTGSLIAGRFHAEPPRD